MYCLSNKKIFDVNYKFTFRYANNMNINYWFQINLYRLLSCIFYICALAINHK